MHKISLDLQKRLIRLEVSGFGDKAAVDALSAEMTDAVLKFKKIGQQFNWLADLRSGNVLPAESLDHMQRLVTWMGGNGMRKSAILVASPLLKMQIARSSADLPVSIFTSEEEALAWLES